MIHRFSVRRYRKFLRSAYGRLFLNNRVSARRDEFSLEARILTLSMRIVNKLGRKLQLSAASEPSIARSVG